MAAKHKLYESTKRKKPEASLINKHKNWFMNTTPTPAYPVAYTYVWRTPARARTRSIKYLHTMKHTYQIILFNRLKGGGGTEMLRHVQVIRGFTR